MSLSEAAEQVLELKNELKKSITVTHSFIKFDFRMTMMIK